MENKFVMAYTYRKLLTAAVETMEADLRVIARKLGLTVSQYNLLFFIYLKPGSSLSQLANLTLWNVSNVMHVVDNLSKKDLALKQTDLQDKRLKRVYLTDAGEEKINEAMQLVRSHRFGQVYNQFDNEKTMRLLADIYDLVEALQGPEYVAAIKTNAEKLTEAVNRNSKDI